MGRTPHESVTVCNISGLIRFASGAKESVTVCNTSGLTPKVLQTVTLSFAPHTAEGFVMLCNAPPFASQMHALRLYRFFGPIFCSAPLTTCFAPPRFTPIRALHRRCTAKDGTKARMHRRCKEHMHLRTLRETLRCCLAPSASSSSM